MYNENEKEEEKEEEEAVENRWGRELESCDWQTESQKLGLAEN